MLISFGYSEYMNNIASNHTTETLSRDILLSGNLTYHLTTCTKLQLVTEELRGVVCVDHIINSTVRIYSMYRAYK